MVFQRLTRQKLKDIRAQGLLNCEPMTPNKIEDQDQQPSDNQDKTQLAGTVWLSGIQPISRASYEIRMLKGLVYVLIHKDPTVP